MLRVLLALTPSCPPLLLFGRWAAGVCGCLFLFLFGVLRHFITPGWNNVKHRKGLSAGLRRKGGCIRPFCARRPQRVGRLCARMLAAY